MKIVIVFGIIFHFAALSSTGHMQRCDGKDYFFSYPARKNFFQAQRHCQSKGMHLVEIPDEAVNTFIKTVLTNDSLYGDTQTSNGWYIGATDNGGEGNFYWVGSGVSLEFEDFNSGTSDPNGGGTENCVAMWRDYGFKWVDVACNRTLYYVCRGDGEACV